MCVCRTPHKMSPMSHMPTKSSERDRFLTAVRGFTMFVVPTVHASMLIFLAGPAVGAVTVGEYVGVLPMSWIFAWAMPSLFAAGGALALKGARQDPGVFIKRRLVRLFAPYWVYAACILVVQIVLWRAGSQTCANGRFGLPQLLMLVFPLPVDCANTSGSLWYLTVFIPITIGSPWLARLYDRRHMRWLLPLLLLVGTLGLDGVHKVLGFSPLPVFILRVFCVWTFFYVLGFLYADRYHERQAVRRWFIPAAVVFALFTAGLVAVAGYPQALLADVDPAGGQGAGNQFPPTFAYLMGGLAMILLLVRFRDLVVRVSQWRYIRQAVDWIDQRSYTIYIWNFAPYAALYWALSAAGLVQARYVPALGVDVGSFLGLPFVVERIFWAAATWALLIPVTMLFYPVERWGGRLATSFKTPKRLLAPSLEWPISRP